MQCYIGWLGQSLEIRWQFSCDLMMRENKSFGHLGKEFQAEDTASTKALRQEYMPCCLEEC